MNHWLPPAAGPLAGLLSVIALRLMVKSRSIANPAGAAERNFDLKPVIRDVLRALGGMGAALLWVVVTVTAMRRYQLDFSYMALIGVIVPAFVGLGFGAFHLLRAAYWAVCGVEKR